jgi:predicted Rossmann fold flavoprotein
MASGPSVTVIGGGASGMMAAISAARAGAAVTLVERMPRVGKKLLATGNGRCNLTNTHCPVSRYHGGNDTFIATVLERFTVAETLAFFENLGIACKTEDEGKVYPHSDQASAVLDVLRYEMEQQRVRLVVEADVVAIVPEGGGFVLQCQDGRQFAAPRVVLAAGGRAGPQFGSNGSGYRLAQRLGHRVIEPLPGIVSLRLGGSFLPRLKGVKFVGAVEGHAGDEVLRREAGEILFTDYGISGPPVLQVSRAVLAAAASASCGPARVALDLFPDLAREQLEAQLIARFETQGRKPVEVGLVGLLNKRLIPVVLGEAGIRDMSQPGSLLPAAASRALAGLLKSWVFDVTGSQSWHDAQVAAGGVVVDEVEPATLESRLKPGLHLCGEVLDVDGDCGGFNLQWAWSSGWVAGRNAAGARRCCA